MRWQLAMYEPRGNRKCGQQPKIRDESSYRVLEAISILSGSIGRTRSRPNKALHLVLLGALGSSQGSFYSSSAFSSFFFSSPAR